MEPANFTSIAPIPQRKPQEVRVVDDVIPILDTARFEQMQRIANVMAHSSLIPDSLCKIKDPNSSDKNKLVPLSPQEILSNCFLVVNQAVRWGMDPFAVGQCVSVVHGKLCYEGKLIAAVIDAKLGIKLEYEITGQGDQMRVVVSGAIDGKPVLDSQGKPKTVTGTVAEWKTTGPGSPWSAPGGHPRMLRYRGAREWGRVHAPSLMLGVYSEDEMEELSENRRAMSARDVTPQRDSGPPMPTIAAAPPAQPEQAPEAEADGADANPPTQSEVIEATAEDVFDAAGFLRDLEGKASGCETLEQLAEVQDTMHKPNLDRLGQSDRKRATSIMVAAYSRISEDQDHPEADT
jgi:hypothetical protein